ncbi:E3 ubiquitin-protein ligase RNF8-like isoform X3 [Octopus vulgaris]|uniref:E3 ubiquitin-protein ligase RNF8-like isoform X3 n=1 Tax=Octopus vulgaris TaxID=6645 RepID=A0AA36FCS4_OCTVU|nr:E3 ubiquitin-protein ligase RNF8-like isoform X3 [Octopus vulgaris]
MVAGRRRIQKITMAANSRERNITWHEIDNLLYFFYEETTSLIPDLWEQKSKSNNEVSVIHCAYSRLSQLLAKIHSKHVKLDSNQDDDYLYNLLSDVIGNFPEVKVSIMAQDENILLESLVKEQLDLCETFVQLQLSREGPPTFQPEALTQISGASGNAILNINEQDQVGASFNLPCKLKLDIYSEDVNTCDVGAVITVQNHENNNEDVTAVCDNYSKYLLCVKEPSRDICSGDQNRIQEYVANIFYQCFNKAAYLKITSVATTLIFTGQFGIPMDTILFSIVQALNQFMDNQVTESCLKEIHIVDRSPETCKVMEQFLTIYWPKNISPRKTYQPHSVNRIPRFQNTSVNSAVQSLDYSTHQLNNLSLHGNHRKSDKPRSINRNPRRYQNASVNSTARSLDNFTNQLNNCSFRGNHRSVATPKGTKNRNVNASGERRDQNQECQICFQTLTCKKTLNCNHSFCQHCLDTWLLIKKSCPLCRAPAH